ncbi:BamA/TamA family outer membrane protein [Halosquirtibacter laminarini]|uniref:BamA/TamA family outer membrane protein n=1 Tax=Halosquirtibacter laminarini TaxID=3374600 RepID=A0AC61NCD3_9BACT|nr:BamA/TamA family outer membrane protein [Prolixibacteraceae bacterium]
MFKKSFLYLLLPFVFFMVACNPTKYVPKDQYLLNKVHIKMDTKGIDKKDLNTYLRQEPNARILGFMKFHLGLYNLSPRKKKESFWTRIGEPPVVFSYTKTERSKEEMLKHLKNLGYYHASIRDSVKFKKNMVDVTYFITLGAPYLISDFTVDIQDSVMRNVVNNVKPEKEIRKGDKFDINKLDKFRNKMKKESQKEGFYKFDEDEIYFTADTLGRSTSVDLTMVVQPKRVLVNDSVVLRPNEKYKIRHYRVYPQFDPKRLILSSEPIKFDTMRIDNYMFLYEGDLRINPKLVIRANHIDDSEFYSSYNVDRTYSQLTQLKLYRAMNIQFIDTKQRSDDGYSLLDCVMQLTPTSEQSYSFELEGTNTSGNLGVGTNLAYQHKNLFKSAERVDVKFSGAIERQRYGTQDTIKLFNTLEGGVDGKFTIPKFWFPFNSGNWFNYSTPQTQFVLSYNYQQRPDYTRTIVRSGFGYRWKSSQFSSHEVNPLDLYLVRMFALDPEFVASIENLTIRSSYTDHSIFAFSYSYTYNTQNMRKRSDYWYLYTKLETSGNLLQLINTSMDKDKTQFDSNPELQYTFFDTPYAQYVKFNVDARRGLVLDKYNTLVFRGYMGVGIPYGNSVQLPFERKYYAGGANDIRGWGARTLGPGSYKSDPSSYPNQVGDVKLEANVEYRFKMVGMFEGALFFDAGNIWSIDDNREGAEFDFDRFYKEFAVSTGVGVRLNFDYAIIRADLGLKLRDPSEPEGSRWIPANRKFQKSDFALSIAIGYPF